MINERQVEFETLRIELDAKTDYSEHKKNRFNRPIKSLRVGLSSSPNVILYAKFKEGDEITLWPGRIVNLSEKSEGVIFRWEGQVNEWVELEVSTGAPYVGGDYRPLKFEASPTASTFRKTYFDVDDITPIQIMAPNENRVLARISNPCPRPILLGVSALDCSPADGLRYQKTIKVMPLENKLIETTGEIFVIASERYAYGPYHRIILEEFLK